MSSERRERTSPIARWTLLVGTSLTGALSLAACLGGGDRHYVDAGPTTGDDATVDSPAEAAPGMDGGMDGAMAQGDGDAMVIEEMAPAETSPPVDAPAEVATGQTFSCNGQTVTSCGNCAGKPVECVFCANDGGHPGVCGPQNMYCVMSAPSGAMACTCNGLGMGDVAQCPAPFQVCTYFGGIPGTFYCQTCGEMGSNNMAPCKDGGHCNTTTAMCQ